MVCSVRSERNRARHQIHKKARAPHQAPLQSEEPLAKRSSTWPLLARIRSDNVKSGQSRLLAPSRRSCAMLWDSANPVGPKCWHVRQDLSPTCLACLGHPKRASLWQSRRMSSPAALANDLCALFTLQLPAVSLLRTGRSGCCAGQCKCGTCCSIHPCQVT